MNYKKILKNRKTRLKILRLLDFIPDPTMLKIQYYIKFKRILNLKNPQRYSEKIQWYKLYYRDPLMSLCSDKADVRDYVKDIGLEEILNECYGVYSSVDEIDFNSLPDSFVIKDTLGGGGNAIIFVEDKNAADLEKIKETARAWTNTECKKKTAGREWVYGGKKHRIIVEKLLSRDEKGNIPDYKFFCFNGQIFCSYMISERFSSSDASKGIMGYFDRNFNLMPVSRTDFTPMKEPAEKPENYEQMLNCVEILAKPFPHVRVDIYNVNGKVVFGELTFFGASGYAQFNPDEFDFEMGKKFVLQRKQK